MQSHANATHSKPAAAPVNLTAGSGSRQVGDTITVAVAFGKIGGVVKFIFMNNGGRPERPGLLFLKLLRRKA